MLAVGSDGSEVVINLTNHLPSATLIAIAIQNGLVRAAAHSTFAVGQGRVRAGSFAKATAPGATLQYRSRVYAQ